MLDRPCEDWFAIHRTKKQKKEPEEGNGESSAKDDIMVYRKIYEGQDGIGFEAYKARLAKARKIERLSEVESRRSRLLPIPDNEFQIIHEKGDNSLPTFRART